MQALQALKWSVTDPSTVAERTIQRACSNLLVSRTHVVELGLQQLTPLGSGVLGV